MTSPTNLTFPRCDAHRREAVSLIAEAAIALADWRAKTREWFERAHSDWWHAWACDLLARKAR